MIYRMDLQKRNRKLKPTLIASPWQRRQNWWARVWCRETHTATRLKCPTHTITLNLIRRNTAVRSGRIHGERDHRLELRGNSMDEFKWCSIYFWTKLSNKIFKNEKKTFKERREKEEREKVVRIILVTKERRERERDLEVYLKEK